MSENLEDKVSFKFPKEERLHHRSLVEGLFRSGKSFYEFPFRVTWRTLSSEQLEKTFCNHTPEGIGRLQMMVTVPKKKRKRAVDRVLLRRRIREAYRLTYLPLLEAMQRRSDLRTLAIGLVYIHNENLPYHHIEEKMKQVTGKLMKLISREN